MYEYSHENGSAGIITFVCPRAPHPKKDGKWISTRSWHRLERPAGTPSLKDCRCKAKLLVMVSKSENRDVAILLHPHECGGGIENDDDDDDTTTTTTTVAAGVGVGGVGAHETAHNNAAATTSIVANASKWSEEEGNDDVIAGGGAKRDVSETVSFEQWKNPV